MKIPLRQYWFLLKRYLQPQWSRVLLLAVVLFSHIGLRLVNPQIVRFFIDTATLGGAVKTLVGAGGLFVGIALLDQVLSIAATYLGETVAWTATNALRIDLTGHCLELDQSFHKEHTPGELVSRIDGDVNTLSNFFSQLVIHLAGNVILILGILTMLSVEDWRVGLGITMFALVALVILIRVRTIAIPRWKKVREQMAEWYGFVGEQLVGTEDIRANGAVGYVMARFYELTRERFSTQIRAGLAGYSMWMISATVFALGTTTAYVLSAYLWDTGTITLGTVYLISHYVGLLYGPIAAIRTQLTDLQQAEASIERIQTLFDTTSRIQDPPAGTATPLPSGPLSVSLKGVSFAYDRGGDKDGLVLDDLSIEILPGRVLGLLGRTGSGKTTLARLLLRLYDADRGDLALGGVSLKRASLQEVRRRAGMVTQDVQLFQATVRNNLTLFNPEITDERLLTVLQDLGMSTWLEGLPDGLDTELQSGGSGLSAGQAQLLAFARVFLADPGLVILDEASSRLDPATEQLIEQAMDKLLDPSHRTGIIIAHRLGTVNRADEILIMDDGRILEYGDRVELRDDPDSHFSRLLQTGLAEVLA